MSPALKKIIESIKCRLKKIESYNFTNGLTKLKTVIKLGGTLVEDTTINLNNKDLEFIGQIPEHTNQGFGGFTSSKDVNKLSEIFGVQIPGVGLYTNSEIGGEKITSLLVLGDGTNVGAGPIFLNLGLSDFINNTREATLNFSFDDGQGNSHPLASLVTSSENYLAYMGLNSLGHTLYFEDAINLVVARQRLYSDYSEFSVDWEDAANSTNHVNNFKAEKEQVVFQSDVDDGIDRQIVVVKAKALENLYEILLQKNNIDLQRVKVSENTFHIQNMPEFADEITGLASVNVGDMFQIVGSNQIYRRKV